MVKKQLRFNFRYNESFMKVIDNWRSEQRPIPSQSEALRLLALRGAAVDSYLSVILQNSIKDLIAAGVFSENSKPEIYERFQDVVQKSLDTAIALEQGRHQDKPQNHFPDPQSEKSIPETLSLDTSAPMKRRHFR